MEGEELVISLLSGLLGVLIGLIIQIVFEHFLSKWQIRQEYKKNSISDWINLKHELRDLFSNFNKRNNIYFRQTFLLKTEALNSIGNTVCTRKKVRHLTEKLKKEDERISLECIAERAFSRSAKNDYKQKFELEVFKIITDTIREIQNI